MQLRVKRDFLTYANDQEKFRWGFLMWLSLFLGYFAFSFNWIILGKLEGSSSGWANDLSASSETLKESVNFSIPFARGVATVPVAWFMKKLTHKYSALMALLLNTSAFPLVFSPVLSLFILGRIIMAFGGTMLVILVQPVLSCFFNTKYKGYLSTVNLTAYVTSGLLANLIFVIPGVETLAQSNWKTVAGIAGSLTYIPLIMYLIFGKSFSIEIPRILDRNLNNDQEEFKSDSYREIIREKDMWFWIFFYSFCLVVSVIAANFAPKVIEKQSCSITQTFSSWKSVYSIIFYLGYLSGFSIGFWNKHQVRRKPFVVLFISLGVFFWLMILLVMLTLSSFSILATVLIFIFVYLFAFCSLGIQSVVFYIPHEYKGNSPKRITIFFSYMWGIGYLLLGIYFAIAASLLDIGGTIGSILSVKFITILVFLTSVFATKLKETRPEDPLIPLSWAERLGIDKNRLYIKNLGSRFSDSFVLDHHENYINKEKSNNIIRELI